MLRTLLTATVLGLGSTHIALADGHALSEEQMDLFRTAIIENDCFVGPMTFAPIAERTGFTEEQLDQAMTNLGNNGEVEPGSMIMTWTLINDACS